MRDMDFPCPWGDRLGISPVLKLISMVLVLALKDKASSVTFWRKKNATPKLLYAVGGKEYDMVPPPDHLYPSILETLRHFCREAEKNPNSAFSFSYAKAADEEEEFTLFIDHSDEAAATKETEYLLSEFYADAQEEELAKREQLARQRQIKQFLIYGAAALIFAAAAFFILLSWL